MKIKLRGGIERWSRRRWRRHSYWAGVVEFRRTHRLRALRIAETFAGLRDASSGRIADWE
jgi:hypothetical protein